MLIILLELWAIKTVLKKTHSHSDSFLTYLWPFSMYCLIKIEIVWTDWALTYSELVSHQSKRSLMKQLPIDYSGTLLWNNNLHKLSIARILVSGSSPKANSWSFQRYSLYSKGCTSSEEFYNPLNSVKSYFEKQSAMTFKEISKASLSGF